MLFTVDIIQHIMPYLNVYDIYTLCKTSKQIRHMIEACDATKMKLSLSMFILENTILRAVHSAYKRPLLMPQIEEVLVYKKWKGNLKLYSFPSTNTQNIVLQSASISWFSFTVDEVSNVFIFVHNVLKNAIPSIYINYNLATSTEHVDDQYILNRINSSIVNQHVYYYHTMYRTYSLNKLSSANK